jgi:hypothetical protein
VNEVKDFLSILVSQAAVIASHPVMSGQRVVAGRQIVASLRVRVANAADKLSRRCSRGKCPDRAY